MANSRLSGPRAWELLPAISSRRRFLVSRSFWRPAAAPRRHRRRRGLGKLPSAAVEQCFSAANANDRTAIIEVPDRAMVVLVEWAETIHAAEDEFTKLRTNLSTQMVDLRAAQAQNGSTRKRFVPARGLPSRRANSAHSAATRHRRTCAEHRGRPFCGAATGSGLCKLLYVPCLWPDDPPIKWSDAPGIERNHAHGIVPRLLRRT